MGRYRADAGQFRRVLRKGGVGVSKSFAMWSMAIVGRVSQNGGNVDFNIHPTKSIASFGEKQPIG